MVRKLIIILTIALLIESCKKENKLPTANAGIDQTVKEGASVTLDGLTSSDPDGDDLTYKWTVPQRITLSSETIAKPNFIAPEVATKTNYTFWLVVNDGQANSLADEVVITIENEDKFLTLIRAGQTDGIGIKYVDFEPNEKFSYYNDPYSAFKNIDMNNDSIDDFELKYSAFHFQKYLQITPLENNYVCVSKSIQLDPPFVESLAFGDSISGNNNWTNSKAYLFTYRLSSYTDYDTGNQVCSEGSQGYWYDHDNIYVGVKIVKDGKELFGWIDVKIKGQGIRGYAVSEPY